MIGLDVVNESGQIQIDSSFSCYEVISSGFVMGNAWGGSIEFGGDGTYLLFARPRNISNHLGRGIISDVSTSFYWEGGDDKTWRASYLSVPDHGRPAQNWQGLDYIIARPSYHQPAISAGMGLQVMSGEGLAAFDSNREYLRIRAVFRSTPGLWLEDFQLPPPSPGKSYYFCVLSLYFTRQEVEQFGDEDYYGYSAGFSPGNVFRVRNGQHLYNWQGTGNQTPYVWELNQGHRPFWIIAEY